MPTNVDRTSETGASPRLHIDCAIDGRMARLTLIEADFLGWDWFTGFNPERQMVCPYCVTNRRGEWLELRRLANIRPTERRI